MTDRSVTAPLLELRGVSKSFGPTRALDGVEFTLNTGEIHVLAGENGAGKSTLIRVLSGVVTDFEGEMWIAGERVRLRDARDAAAHGVATIHQELSLVGSMTVAENLALPRPGSMFRITSAKEEERAARSILASMDLDVDPSALVETLPLATRQLIEIARALAQDARVWILDEPTSALSEPEADRLMARVERLAEEGRGVVYISHRMEENDRLADRITVLCDGRVVASRPANELPREELVALMMGRRTTDTRTTDTRTKDTHTADTHTADTHTADTRTADTHTTDTRTKDTRTTDTRTTDTLAARSTSTGDLLTVRDLYLDHPGVSPLRGLSFSIAPGEIVGLAGLRGSGAGEALAALFGAFGRSARAAVTLAGEPFAIESPARSIAQGLVLLANDRKKTVFGDLTIAENVTLSSLARLAPRALLDLAAELRLTSEMTARLRVAAPGPTALARSLSGGNQQKVALLRCVAAGPRVLLLDEPTRGVDIGAKSEIHRTLRALAAEGKSLLVITSELGELTDLCDRVLVLARGRITGTLARPDLTRERLRLALDAA